MLKTELIATAEAEVGYIGKKSNAQLDDKTANTAGKYTKYARDMFEAGQYNGNKNGYDFCCVFMDWLFLKTAGGDVEKAKAVKNWGIYGAGVNYVKGAMPGRIFDKPEVGDQVLFKDSSGSLAHTGLVVQVFEDGAFQTIEGNVTGYKVDYRAYAADNPRVDSFVRPYYEEPEKPTEPEQEGEIIVWNNEDVAEDEEIVTKERLDELLEKEKVADALKVLVDFVKK